MVGNELARIEHSSLGTLNEDDDCGSISQGDDVTG